FLSRFLSLDGGDVAGQRCSLSTAAWGWRADGLIRRQCSRLRTGWQHNLLSIRLRRERAQAMARPAAHADDERAPHGPQQLADVHAHQWFNQDQFVLGVVMEKPGCGCPRRRVGGRAAAAPPAVVDDALFSVFFNFFKLICRGG
ncbi:unnamed protein product, partial [Urochloa humidicola]